MAMGSKGTINISVQMMNDVKEAVSEYRERANSLQEQLNSEMSGLIGTNFEGEAARGFQDFYNNNIVPANGEGLANLLKAIDDIAQSISDAIPGSDGLDDQLAEGNRQ